MNTHERYMAIRDAMQDLLTAPKGVVPSAAERFYSAKDGRISTTCVRNFLEGFTCSKCGAETEISAPDPSKTVCQNCCEDHDYQTDTCAGWALCVNCNKPAPDDFYVEGPDDYR